MRPNGVRIMNATGPRRILLCADDPGAVEDVRRLLNGSQYQIVGHSLDAVDPETRDLHLAVIEGRTDGAALRYCRRLRQRLGDVFVPILYLIADATPPARLAPFEAGADTYLLRPFVPGELLAQVGALLRIKELHDRLAEKTAEVHRINRRLQQAYAQIDAELELARRIQMSFLPQSLPEVPVRALPSTTRSVAASAATSTMSFVWMKITSASTSPTRWDMACRPVC